MLYQYVKKIKEESKVNFNCLFYYSSFLHQLKRPRPASAMLPITSIGCSTRERGLGASTNCSPCSLSFGATGFSSLKLYFISVTLNRISEPFLIQNSSPL